MNIDEDFEKWWRSTPILGENKRTIAEKAWTAARAPREQTPREIEQERRTMEQVGKDFDAWLKKIRGEK